MKIGKQNRAGFTLIEVMIVVAIIGLLAAIAIPNLVHARTRSQMNACINNLRIIDDAKQNWAMDNPVSAKAKPTDAQLQPYIGRGTEGSLPTCPLDANNSFDSSYNPHSLRTAPTCRIDSTNHVLK